ncbi:MAG TPA: 30S ribosome-binding factor RbfA [Patescibacteria group bacterium]|nr:30S ribosome-binding factor RbfA [Patescibacteria group bacterium]
MTKRTQRVNQLIRKEISMIFLREVIFPEGTLVTVTRVETADNLAQSRIFVSSIPENKIKSVLLILNKQIYQLQQELNQRLNMRPVPRICFVKEKETLEAGRIEEILANLKEKEK